MKKIFFGASLLCFSSGLFAQDDLLNLVNDGNQKKDKDFTIATFKTTRLVNFHTIETQSRKTLDFRISHRFGDLGANNVSNLGYNAFGLDAQASIKLSLEYSFDGRLQVGIGRCNDQKMVDGFAKYRLLRQAKGKGASPVSITLFAGVYRTFIRTGGDGYYKNEMDRFSFCDQIMIARKFNRRFSLQVGAAYVHYNIVNYLKDLNDAYFATALFRFKLSNRVAITAEYAMPLNQYYIKNPAPGTVVAYYPSTAIGFDVETGGHVFQIAVCNSFGLDEPEYFAHTDKMWSTQMVRIGFNISRVFDL
jgi:hypothetical protein